MGEAKIFKGGVLSLITSISDEVNIRNYNITKSYLYAILLELKSALKIFWKKGLNRPYLIMCSPLKLATCDLILQDEHLVHCPVGGIPGQVLCWLSWRLSRPPYPAPDS